MNVLTPALNIILGIIVFALIRIIPTFNIVGKYSVSLLAILGIFYGIIGLWQELRIGDGQNE
jgi:hypothetical protein